MDSQIWAFDPTIGWWGDMTRPVEMFAAEGQNDFLRRRLWMVDTQLRRRGIIDSRVLQAMREVPRETFVPSESKPSAYDDCALPIASEQTISQPYTVAFMCEALQLAGDEKVLEIGTGSGYAAAVLCKLAREAHTVERLSELAVRARDRLARVGASNVHVHVADGTLGLPDEAPFDAIVVTAGGTVLPKPFVSQLGDGGRIVIPLGSSSNSQTMYRYTKDGRKLRQENLGRFAFVPLIGMHAWND